MSHNVFLSQEGDEYHEGNETQAAISSCCGMHVGVPSKLCMNFFLGYFRETICVYHIEVTQRFRLVAYRHRPFLRRIRYCYPYQFQRTFFASKYSFGLHTVSSNRANSLRYFHDTYFRLLPQISLSFYPYEHSVKQITANFEFFMSVIFHHANLLYFSFLHSSLYSLFCAIVSRCEDDGFHEAS